MKTHSILFLLNLLVQIKGTCHKANSTLTPIILDPYVSILDKQNPYRYNVDALLPLISTVATKFNVIIVDLAKGPHTFDETTFSSKVLLPFAVAKYNEIASNLTSCLEMWFTGSINEFAKTLGIIQRLKEQYNSTVFRMLVQRELVELAHNLAKTLNRTAHDWKDKVGWITPECVSTINTVLLKIFSPRVVLMEYSIRELENIDSRKVIANLESKLSQCHQAYDLPGLPSVNIGFIVSLSDTSKNGRVYMSRMVEIWKDLRNWSNNSGNMVIFSKAFDTPYDSTIGLKTDGWWSLIENVGYKNTKEYIFKEKSEIAKEFDLQEKTLNVTEPTKSELSISKPLTGVIISFLAAVKGTNSSLAKTEIESLFKMASNFFSKAIIVFDQNLNLTETDYADLNRFLIKVKQAFLETSVMFSTHVNVSYYIPVVFNSKIISNVPAVYFACSRNSDVLTKLRENWPVNETKYHTNIGCTFNISVCGIFAISRNEKKKLDQTLNTNDAKNIVFLYEEDEETVKLGASRMFAQRITIFEQCRKIALKKHYEVSFVLLHYATDTQFYSSLEALQSFVKYWEMLRKWSINSNTTVVLGDAFDGTRVFEASKLPLTQIGWWRRSQTENNKWINKRTDAISLAKGVNLNPPTLVSLSTQQIVIIVCSTFVIFVAVVIMTISFLRSRNQETLMNQEEIDDFLHGLISSKFESAENQVEITTNPYSLPYDKEKYELLPSTFTVDFGNVLGSGEFGSVLRGKVENDQHEVTKVAVKVINEKKFHKTAITSLLAEIKILAYIGKHDNIIELIGANTTDVMNGKVFVFLELCELGSLEKYLRKLQPELMDCYPENSATTGSTNEQIYENLEAVDQRILDPSVCDEFYRWSIEICSAMTYLATKHVVHADLATRNVLLTAIKQAKICDFGLSRRMYNYTNYVKTKQEPLPWKWMAPESLKIAEFNEKSDLWSYGVLLWEIYSLGDTHYAGLSWDVNFVRVLEGGLRLGQPKYDHKNIYTKFMNECWKLNPKIRPSFADMLLRLSQLDMY